jgi:hypothetical protein
MSNWQPPVRIPTGALLVPKQGKDGHILPRSRTPIYLGWDIVGCGMKLLFPDGCVSTHEPEDVLNIFEEAQW